MRRGVMRFRRPIRLRRGVKLTARVLRMLPEETRAQVESRRTRSSVPRAVRLAREAALAECDRVRAMHLPDELWQHIPGLHLQLRGQLPSGKNAQGIRYDSVEGLLGAGGPRKHPSQRFVHWREDAQKQLLTQMRNWKSVCPIAVPMMLYVWYWPGDRLARDRSGMLDALFHLFERSGVIANDKWIEDPVWRTMPMDRTNPRVELVLMPFISLPQTGYAPPLSNAMCPCCWFPLSSLPLPHSA